MKSIKEIKESFSDGVKIIRLIRTTEVQESFNKIKDTASIAKEIIEALKSPEMVRNIENFRLISEQMNEASTKIQNTMKNLEETGIISEASGLVRSAKNTVDSFGKGQDLIEVGLAVKEMFKSIRALVDELRITTIYSKKSGTASNIRETINDISDIYNNEIKTTIQKDNNKIYSDY